MRNRYGVLIVAMGVALAALGARPAWGISASELPDEVKTILDRTIEVYLNADTYRDNGRIEIRMNADDAARAHVMSLPLLFERPNKIRMNVEAVLINSDGNDLYRYSQLFKRYTKDSSPEKLDSRALFGPGASRGTDLFVHLWLLLGQEPIEKLLANATSVEIAGEEEVDGRRCQVVLIQNRPGFLNSLLLIDGESGLLREFRMVGDESTAKLRPGAPQFVSLKFDELAVNDPVKDDAFEFALPADAKQVDDLSRPNNLTAKPADDPETLDKTASNDKGKPQKTTMKRAQFGKGLPAPDWELKTLDGKTLSLSDLKGKVVVLDFWAAWCGPCRRAFPYLERMSKSFEGKPVQVIGVCVDRRSNMERINAVLNEGGVTFTNVIDRSGEMSAKYQAMSLPTTILIDKDGVVQRVSRGFSPREFQILAGEIQKQIKE